MEIYEAVYEAVIYVSLEPEWEFMKLLDDVEAVEREKAIFECDVSDPEADVTWWRGDKVRQGFMLTKLPEMCIVYHQANSKKYFFIACTGLVFLLQCQNNLFMTYI